MSSTELNVEYLSRILLVTFNHPPSANQVYIKLYDDLSNLNIADVISQCLGDIISTISLYDHFKLPITNELAKKNDNAIKQMNEIPIWFENNSIETEDINTILTYLIDCYSRILIEEINYPRKCNSPPVVDLLTEIRTQIMNHFAYALQTYCCEDSNRFSPLIKLIINQSLPRGFLSEFITRIHRSHRLLRSVFTPVLQGFYYLMLTSSLGDDNHMYILGSLFELTEIQCNKTRPICLLITEQVQFSPETITTLTGKIYRFQYFKKSTL